MKRYLLLSFVIALLGGGAYVAERQFSASSTSPTTSSAATTSPEVKSPEIEVKPQSQVRLAQSSANVTFKIENKDYALHAPAGTSVLDAMRALASSSGLTFTGRDYPGLGFFVESINGKKNAGGYYWFLYLNSTSSQTGVSQTIIRADDAVEWRYEKDHY